MWDLVYSANVGFKVKKSLLIILSETNTSKILKVLFISFSDVNPPFRWEELTHFTHQKNGTSQPQKQNTLC